MNAYTKKSRLRFVYEYMTLIASVFQDLRRLITRALPQSKDLVLVGSQLGSLNMLQYAHSFPEGVSQLVLIDPPHPSLFEGEGWPTYVKEYWKPYNRMVQTMALFGLNRMGLLLGAVKSPPPCRLSRSFHFCIHF